MKAVDCKGYRFSNTHILLFMYILIVADYILTYYGIHVIKVIKEANPLMVKFMDLPFFSGIIIRNIIALLIIFLLKAVEKRITVKYNFLLIKILVIQVIPYTFHGIWIYSYLKLKA